MTAASPKFCLIAPEPAVSEGLGAALETGLVEAVILAGAANGSSAGLVDLTARFGAALLVVDDVELAGQIGAGLLATRADCDPGPLRARLGDDAIVGIVSGVTRHAGLEAAQAGADFVGLGEIDREIVGEELETLVELVAWWDEIIEIPCVAFGAGTPQVAVQLLDAGADTVALNPALWATEAPAATLRSLAGQIKSRQ